MLVENCRTITTIPNMFNFLSKFDTFTQWQPSWEYFIKICRRKKQKIMWVYVFLYPKQGY